MKIRVVKFNTIHTFDYDFWQTWNINDIVQNITDCRKDYTPRNRRIIAMEHATCLKCWENRQPKTTRNAHLL